MILRNHEFSFSKLNANDVERMEAARTKQLARAKAEQARYAREKSSVAEILRSQCRILMDFFDEVLGAGASALLGLDGNDLNDCLKVSQELKDAMEAEDKAARAMVEPIGLPAVQTPVLQSAPQNRAQRRNKHHRHG